MLGADIGVVEGFGFFGCESENFFDTGSVRNIADHLLIGTGADLFLDLHADGLEVQAELLKHVDGDALAELDQAEQEVLGADEIVIKTVGLLACQCEHLLRARGEIIGCFIAHKSQCNHFSGLSNPAPEGGSALAIGLLTCRSRSRTISARSKSRSSAESFSVCCFWRWAGCVIINNSSTKARSTPGNNPISTPKRIKESKFIVSFEEMLWALAKMP